MVGIQLFTALVLAMAVIIVELRIVFSIPMLKRIATRGAIFGIAISVGLSFTLGTLFGASGLVVMIAALVATGITQPVYAITRRRNMASSIS